MKTKKLLSLTLVLVMVVSMMAPLGFTASAAQITQTNEEYLDLDSTTDIKEKKELDQNYNLTVNEGTKTDSSKVKLTWEITDISATRTDNKVWNTTELCWETSTSSMEITQSGTAKFTLENYSSVKVDAKVTFDTVEYEEGKKFTAPTLVFDEDNDENTEDDGIITIDTANGNDTYSKSNVPTGEITVTVTPDTDDFEKLSATTTAAKYGTYTVTIGKVEEMVTLTFTNSNSHSTLTYNETEYVYSESFYFSVPKKSIVSIVGAGTSQSTLTVDGKTVTQTSASSWPCQWGTPSGRLTNGTVITEALDIHSASK